MTQPSSASITTTSPSWGSSYLPIEKEFLASEPAWLRFSHVITGAALLLALMYLLIARSDREYVGHAVVRSVGKFSLTSTIGGLAIAVDVSIGHRVEAGQVLVRFEQRAGTLGQERVLGHLRSPVSGIVTDLRIRPGQAVRPGETVGSIDAETGGFELVTFLPGEAGPYLGQTAEAVVTFPGYARSNMKVRLEQISRELMDASAAKRFAESEDLPILGKVISARSFIDDGRFYSGDTVLRLRDGMAARATVSLRKEMLLVRLVPQLRPLFER